MIFKGAHRERNQPVPVRGFKPFCYRALNICSKIRGGAKNNQCHGTVALARWAPLFNTMYPKIQNKPSLGHVTDTATE